MLTLLERKRIDAYLSVDELAERTGVPSRTIRRMEARQVRRPQMKTLKPLAEFFDAPASSLLDESQPVPA